jgi:hypothetical protein
LFNFQDVRSVIGELDLPLYPFPFPEGAETFWSFLIRKFPQFGVEPQCVAFGGIAVNFEHESTPARVQVGRASTFVLRATDSCNQPVTLQVANLKISLTSNKVPVKVEVQIREETLLVISFRPLVALEHNLTVKDVSCDVKYAYTFNVAAAASANAPGLISRQSDELEESRAW